MKKSNQVCLCTNYRALNESVLREVHPLLKWMTPWPKWQEPLFLASSTPIVASGRFLLVRVAKSSQPLSPHSAATISSGYRLASAVLQSTFSVGWVQSLQAMMGCSVTWTMFSYLDKTMMSMTPASVPPYTWSKKLDSPSTLRNASSAEGASLFGPRHQWAAHFCWSQQDSGGDQHGEAKEHHRAAEIHGHGKPAREAFSKACRSLPSHFGHSSALERHGCEAQHRKRLLMPSNQIWPTPLY